MTLCVLTPFLEGGEWHTRGLHGVFTFLWSQVLEEKAYLSHPVGRTPGQESGNQLVESVILDKTRIYL